MTDLPIYEKTYDFLMNGEKHNRQTWFDDRTMQEMTFFVSIPSRWGPLYGAAEDQLGRNLAFRWTRTVEDLAKQQNGQRTLSPT